LGGLGNQAAPTGVAGERQSSAVGGKDPMGECSLSVRTAQNPLSAEAAGRIDPDSEADALRTDAMDALIKSALDFLPPPMPRFDIIAPDSS